MEGEAGPLLVAERYSDNGWWQHWLDFPYSKILRRISSHLFFNTLLAVLVSLYQQVTHALRPFPAMPLILCSTAMGLLLVFRTTAAYERWQLGQRYVYDLKFHLQQILRLTRPWLSEDAEHFTRLQVRVRSFPRSIVMHLTAKPGAGFIYGIGPRDLMTHVSDELAVFFAADGVPTAALYSWDRTQGHIGEVLRIVGDMERLASEAVPRDYSRHSSRFLSVWMCTLPFVCLECGRLMPLTVAIISWALLSIEEIGHTLEDPFNSPTEPVQVKQILEYGGGEHSLQAGIKDELPDQAPLWERRIHWGRGANGARVA